MQTNSRVYVFDESYEGRLTCIATGIPAVTIYWQFEGVNITSDPSNVITNSFSIAGDLILTTGRLTLTSVERSNEGTYTCIGTNGRGANISVDSNVIVNCKGFAIRIVYFLKSIFFIMSRSTYNYHYTSQG